MGYVAKKFIPSNSIQNFIKLLVANPKIKIIVAIPRGKNHVTSQLAYFSRVNNSPSTFSYPHASNGILSLLIHYLPTFHHSGQCWNIKSHYKRLTIHYHVRVLPLLFLFILTVGVRNIVSLNLRCVLLAILPNSILDTLGEFLEYFPLTPSILTT